MSSSGERLGAYCSLACPALADEKGALPKQDINASLLRRPAPEAVSTCYNTPKAHISKCRAGWRGHGGYRILPAALPRLTSPPHRCNPFVRQQQSHRGKQPLSVCCEPLAVTGLEHSRNRTYIGSTYWRNTGGVSSA